MLQEPKTAMATSSIANIPSLPLLPPTVPHNPKLSLPRNRNQSGGIHRKPSCFKVRAAKLPAGVELPRVEPKFEAPFWGFTRTAEIWNSRACMIGLIGTFIVELILNKGILQLIGVDVGKGLDIPL